MGLIVFGVEPHTGQRAEDRFHHLHLGRGKRAAFQDRAIAEQDAWIEMTDQVVLSPGNRGGGIVVGHDGNAEVRQILFQPERMATFFLALLLHARQLKQRVRRHHQCVTELQVPHELRLRGDRRKRILCENVVDHQNIMAPAIKAVPPSPTSPLFMLPRAACWAL